MALSDSISGPPFFLEPLVRALGDDPACLDNINGVIHDLEKTEAGRRMIPEGCPRFGADLERPPEPSKTMSQTTFNPDQVLKGLKDFQRLTVDYVFHRLYCDADRLPVPGRRRGGLGAKTSAWREALLQRRFSTSRSREKTHRRCLHLLERRHCSPEHKSPEPQNRGGAGVYLPTRITLLPLFLPKLNQQGRQLHLVHTRNVIST